MLSKGSGCSEGKRRHIADIKGTRARGTISCWIPRVILFLPLLVAGCVVNAPPEYKSEAVQAVCQAGQGETVSVTHNGVTKSVTVYQMPTWEELEYHCGETGGACIFIPANEIYMIDDGCCARYASHELGHLFAMNGLDVPTFANCHK